MARVAYLSPGPFFTLLDELRTLSDEPRRGQTSAPVGSASEPAVIERCAVRILCFRSTQCSARGWVSPEAIFVDLRPSTSYLSGPGSAPEAPARPRASCRDEGGRVTVVCIAPHASTVRHTRLPCVALSLVRRTGVARVRKGM